MTGVIETFIEDSNHKQEKQNKTKKPNKNA